MFPESQEYDQVSENNTADIKTVLLGVFVLVSGVTSFAFFWVYLGNLFPNFIGDAWISHIISGLIGFICFEAAAFGWMRAYLSEAATSQQRTIALQASIAALAGGTIASFVWVILSGTQLVDLSPQVETMIGWLAVVSVSVAISFHMISAWRYTKNSHQARLNQLHGRFQAREQKAMEQYETSLQSRIHARMGEKMDGVADQIADFMTAQQVAARMKRLYDSTRLIEGFEHYLVDGRHARQLDGQGLVAPTATAGGREDVWVILGDDSGILRGPYAQVEARAKAKEWQSYGFDDYFHVLHWDPDLLGVVVPAAPKRTGWGVFDNAGQRLHVGGLSEAAAHRVARTWNDNCGGRRFSAGPVTATAPTAGRAAEREKWAATPGQETAAHPKQDADFLAGRPGQNRPANGQEA